jgi:hypothetical protein
MSAKQVWVSPTDEGWKVKSANANKAAAIVETKAEAVVLARGIAINKGAELIVQNLDGQIGWRNSHGHDPFPPRG